MDQAMGNQQEVGVVAEADAAWLAGMLNGDGCFSLTFATRKSGNIKCDISLTLTQCDPSLIEKTTCILGTLGINPSISEYPPSGAGIRTKYNLRINRMSHIAVVIDAISAFMVGEKLAQAKLMRRYIARRAIYSDPTKRQSGASILDDKEAIEIATQFNALRKPADYKGLPKHITDVLNDYPFGEYSQVAGSAQHAQA